MGFASKGVAAAALVVGISAIGCEGGSTPTTPPSFDSPATATQMVASAIEDFECAFGAAVVAEGLISDELADAQLDAAVWPYDRRDFSTLTNGIYGTNGCADAKAFGVYTPLSTARLDADNALKKLGAWTDAQVPDRMTLIAQMNLYAGFSYTILGMTMCQAVFDGGAPVDQQGMFALAERRLSDAMTAASPPPFTATRADIRAAAFVVRARVRLFQGNLEGAGADAQILGTPFVFNANTDSSDPRNYNRVVAATQQTGNFTVEPQSLDLKTERGESDPRSATVVTATRAADARSVILVPKKYASTSTATGLAIPMPIARFEEMELIRAEVRGGTLAAAIINSMRAEVGLKPYDGSTDATSIRNLIIDERRRVLFAEGFRNYDIQRFNLPLNPPPGSTYPRVGGTYGNTTCLPLPDIARHADSNVP